MDGERLLLSLREAAKRLGICERSLWGLSAPRGPIPVVRLGGRVLYRPEDLRDYLAKLAAESVQSAASDPQEAGR